ncbi:MAG: hypothetical protein Q4E51_06560 [Lachnospiraceae bacterium]|nr:hypothetical protein [Lachnospiraceae bacterium]
MKDRIKCNNTIVITTCIIIVMLIYYIPKAYGIFFPQDEFGYWNNAAKIIGIDWSDIAIGQASYAYGYSVVLVPLMFCFKSNPLVLYRMAIIVNAVLMIFYSCLFRKLIEKIFVELSDVQKSLMALFCVFSPYVVGYVHYVMAEILLNLLFVILLNIAVDVEKNGINLNAILGGCIVCILMLLVHYRTIGISFSYAMFVTSFLWNKEKKQKIILLSTTILFIVAVLIFIICNSRNLNFVKELNSSGVISFFIGIFGKFYYSFVATLGLGCVGIGIMVKNRTLRFNQFYLVSFIMLCLIGSYFFIGTIRFDQIVYGRYTEMFLPLFSCYGLNEIINRRMNRISMIKACIIMGVFSTLITLYTSYEHLREYVPNFVSGIDWMIGSTEKSILWLFIKPFYFATISLVVCYAFVSIKKNSFIILVTFLILSIFSSIYVINNRIYYFQNNDKSDYEMSIKIKELTSDDDREVVFLDSPYNNYINLMQYWLMDEKIILIQGLDPEAFQTADDAIVITHSNYELPEQLQQRYDEVLYSSHFRLYYN